MAQKYEIPGSRPFYGGHQYDSDLEGQWAVLFDNTGIKYTPHPATFRTGKFYSGKEIEYSPDFYLCDFKIFCEVKPEDGKLLDCEIQRKISAAMDENFSSISNGLMILGPMKGFSKHDSKKLLLSGDYYWWCNGKIARTHWQIRKSESGEAKTTISFSNPEWSDDSNFSSYPYLPRNSSTKLCSDFECLSASEMVYKALFDAIYAKQNGLFSYDVSLSNVSKQVPVIQTSEISDSADIPWN